MKIYFFILLLGLFLEHRAYMPKIPNNGYGTMYANEYLYLDIMSYHKGDDIYLEVSNYCNTTEDFYLKYLESNFYEREFFFGETFENSYPYSYSQSSSYISDNEYYYYDYTFYFNIKLKTDHFFL